MGKKILVIEDNSQDRKALQRFLNKAGYEDISMVERGEEGIEKVKSEKFDLIILDTVLPDMSGFEICSKIREITGQTGPKILVVTGSIDAVDALKAKKAGADDHCVKTSDWSPIITAVKKLI